jgi:phosphoserine phosphatase
MAQASARPQPIMPNFALVLTAAPGTQVLTQTHIHGLAPHLGPSQAHWLAEGEAWEAIVTRETAQEANAIRAAARDLLGALPVDVNVVPAGTQDRRKALLVADMESTIIEQELLDEIAREAGLGEMIAPITAQAMRGEIPFEAALRERVALLKGLDVAVLDTVYRRVTLMPGAEILVRTMKKNDAYCGLVSGGFTAFTERVAKRLGFDEHVANVLAIDNGHLAGRVIEPILGREAKLHIMRRFARERGIATAQILAAGDGANDLAMIREAGLGVAFRAKPVVAAGARASIVHGDLTALLYLQGYGKSEFAEA